MKEVKVGVDTGGAGRWRGGVGLERSWQFPGEEATLSIPAERTRIRPWGLFGGSPGATAEFIPVHKEGKRERLKGKTRVTIRRGDILIARTPGAGGYGNPLERDPESVLRDVSQGLVSVRAALAEYGVVIDRARRIVDEEVTRRVRSLKSARGGSRVRGIRSFET